MSSEMISINGIVEDVIYKNEDNGYTVLNVDSDGALVTVVGNLGDICDGERLSLMGNYINNAKYGRQFKAEVCERFLPTSISAIKKYLGSGVLQGVGPSIAKRIVEAFGEDTLDILEKSSYQLSSIKGITPERAQQIGDEFRRITGVRSTISFLSKFGISPMVAVNVYKQFEGNAVDVIRTNPYALCGSGIDVDFFQADEIAKSLGFDNCDLNRIRAGIIFTLRENTNVGHTCLPLKRLKKTACHGLDINEKFFIEGLEFGVSSNDLIYGEANGIEYVYLSEYFYAENYISLKLAEMIKLKKNTKTDFNEEIAGIEWSENIQYEELQKKAISGCMNNNVFILTGGPGTGKTTTLNAVIQLCKQRKMKLKLAAPTGRAAKRMADLTGNSAQTIHRLLEVDFSRENMLLFKHNEKDPLVCDVVIIDEMSMIDALLMESLLRAIKSTTKLIMVGDSNQLPSVGAGNVLRDLISSNLIPMVELKEIFRQAAQSLIVTNAHKIVGGELPILNERKSDFFFINSDDENDTVRTVIDLCKSRLPNTYDFSPIDDIQVLTPSRLGTVGTRELNKSLQIALNPPSHNKLEIKHFDVLFRTGDKVMQMKNDYNVEWKKGSEKGHGVFNGDIGIIKNVDRQSDTIMIDFEGRIAVYTADMFSKIEHAYAITIHKSQGSEYGAVVLPLPIYMDKLSYRNLLYTAVTRAKNILVIVGTQGKIIQMVRNDKKKLRFSCLKDMLEAQLNDSENSVS